MNFGIIGCSRVARRRFLPAFAESDCARLISVGSRSPAKAGEYAREFGAEQFGDYDSILANKKVDAVYISTPPLLHTEWVLKAAKAGKHIICEKPAFPTLAEARAALAACRRANVRLFENYAFLYHPQHAAARALLPKIGGLARIEVEYLYPFPPEGDIRLKPELGGGVFHDSFGYPIALSLWYFDGTPSSVSYKKTFDSKRGIDIAGDIALHFSNGRELTGRVEIGSERYTSHYTLHGPKGSIEVCRAFAVDADKPAAIVATVANCEEKITIPPASQFQLALEDFCAAVRDDIEKNYAKEILARAEIKERALLSYEKII